MRVVWITLGFAFVAIGAVGIFVPLLPTTPFLLLAAACFVRGSDRAYRWLLATPPFGPMIHEWNSERAIRRKDKTFAQLLIVLSFGSSALFFVPILWARIVVGALGIVALVLVSRLPVRRRDASSPAGVRVVEE